LLQYEAFGANRAVFTTRISQTLTSVNSQAHTTFVKLNYVVNDMMPIIIVRYLSGYTS